MHILPKGYTRSRSFGGYHGGKRQDYLNRCRESLTIASPQPIKPPERIEPTACEMSAMRHRDVLQPEPAASELEGGLRPRDLRRSGHLFTDALRPFHGVCPISPLSPRTGRIATMRTTTQTLTAPTVTGNPPPIPGMASSPNRGQILAFTNLFITTTHESRQATIGGPNLRSGSCR